MNKQEQIQQARDENRLIQQQFPLASIKTTQAMLEKEGFTVLDTDTETLKKQGMGILSFAANQAIDEKSFNVGQQLKDIAMRSIGIAAIKKEKRKIEKDNKEPFQLRFPLKVGAKMYEQLKEQFTILSKTVSMDSKEMKIDFDISDCVSKSDLAKRIAQIYGAAKAIGDDIQKASEFAYIKEMSDALSRAEIKQTAIRFKKVTGQYLIDNNIAERIYVDHTFYQSQFSKAVGNFYKRKGFWSRLWEYLTAKAKFEYIYCDTVVVAENEYVIECYEPCDKLANHNEEMTLRYEFGEQVYRGFGIQLVVQYVKDIEKVFNAAIDELEQPNSDTDNN